MNHKHVNNNLHLDSYKRPNTTFNRTKNKPFLDYSLPINADDASIKFINDLYEYNTPMKDE
jgi:hypothetical protein